MDLNRQIQKRFDIRRKGSLPFTCRRRKTLHRDDLAAFFGEMGYTKGAEVGVNKGSYSLMLCQNMPDLHLLCVDPWKKVKYSPISDERNARSYEIAKTVLAPYNATLIAKTSTEAVRDVEDESLDFVFIDAMHDFDSCMLDIIEWSRRVKRGGIVAGHDFGFVHFDGVFEAAQAYTRAHHIHPWYCTRDQPNSFFWVKP